MINTKINKWTIIEETGKDKWGSMMVKCKCDCGTIAITRLSDIKRNKTLQCKPCGYKFKRMGIPILKSELSGKGNNYKHGMCRTATYQSWCSMITRCADTGKNYKWYGARGIKVCDRWFIFDNFYEDMGEKPTNMYLDRIDNDKGYFKENCRWVNSIINSRNRRNVKNVRDDLPPY